MSAPPGAGRAVIVSGLPRSGTSLLMAMLEAGGLPLLTDGARAADGSNPRGYFEYEPVKRLTADSPWLAETPGRAVKIVIPLVRRLPPDLPCDVLLLERAMPEILASQSAMLAARGIPAADPAVLAPAFARELALTRETLSGFPGCRFFRIQHRDLVNRPLEISGEIATFLGLPLDAARMASRVAPALHRQREGGHPV